MRLGGFLDFTTDARDAVAFEEAIKELITRQHVLAPGLLLTPIADFADDGAMQHTILQATVMCVRRRSNKQEHELIWWVMDSVLKHFDSLDLQFEVTIIQGVEWFGPRRLELGGLDFDTRVSRWSTVASHYIVTIRQGAMTGHAAVVPTSLTREWFELYHTILGEYMKHVPVGQVLAGGGGWEWPPPYRIFEKADDDATGGGTFSWKLADRRKADS